MGATTRTTTWLVGDIGGTNARFALARTAQGAMTSAAQGGATGGVLTLEQVRSLPGRDHAGLAEAALHYLAGLHERPVLDAACLACAGAVLDGSVSFTNLPWRVEQADLACALGTGRVVLLNDLEAVAWAAPGLARESLRRLGGPDTVGSDAPGTSAILNAGTGCNASAFVAHGSGAAVVAGEYGHTSFAPTDELETEIWRRLHTQFGRVSIERVLCGPGLLNLYRALADIEQAPCPCATPAEVTHEAERAADGLAARAVDRFCALMGSVAGDVALCFGARLGVYLAGGVATSLLTEARQPVFRARFEDKGRFRNYLAEVPTCVITDQQVALLGAARALAAGTTIVESRMNMARMQDHPGA